jgi:hypothetical protein
MNLIFCYHLFIKSIRIASGYILFFQLIHNSDGTDVIMPNRLGSIIFTGFIYIYNLYIWVLNLEYLWSLLMKIIMMMVCLTKSFFYNVRVESKSLLEVSIGLDLYKWLGCVPKD